MIMSKSKFFVCFFPQFHNSQFLLRYSQKHCGTQFHTIPQFHNSSLTQKRAVSHFTKFSLNMGKNYFYNSPIIYSSIVESWNAIPQFHDSKKESWNAIPQFHDSKKESRNAFPQFHNSTIAKKNRGT